MSEKEKQTLTLIYINFLRPKCKTQEVLCYIYAECFMCVFLDAKFVCLLTLWFKLPLYTQTDAHTHSLIQTITDAHQHRQYERWNTRERELVKESLVRTPHIFSSTLMESTMENGKTSKYTKSKWMNWPTSIELATLNALYMITPIKHTRTHTLTRTHTHKHTNDPRWMCRQSKPASEAGFSKRKRETGRLRVRLIRFAYVVTTYTTTVNECLHQIRISRSQLHLHSHSHHRWWWW